MVEMKTVFTVLCILAAGSEARGIGESYNFRDHGQYLSLGGMNFTLNGSPITANDSNCIDHSCHKESLQKEQHDLEEMLNSILLNITALDHRRKRVPNREWKNEPVGILLRRKRGIFKSIWNGIKNIGKSIVCVATLGIVCPKSGKTTVIVADPHAEQRYLIEKERARIEALAFCYENCARNWEQWSPCTKPCGTGSQYRTRALTLPPKCTSKFPEFQCPHNDREEKPCNEGCPNGGESSDTGCSCPDKWGGTCCTREKYCDYPGIPLNGHVAVHSSPSPVGSVAMFECNPGFVRAGPRYASCQSNEQWSSTPPDCTSLYCSPPVLTDHLKILNEQENYGVDSSIHFGCDAGYVVEGPASRKCLDLNDEGRWSQYTPYCKETECPALTQSDIPNGLVHGYDFTYESEIRFSCRDGFELIGLETITCTKYGRWSGFFPTCEVLTCPVPLPPVSGDMKMFGDDTILFSCNIGYAFSDVSDTSLYTAYCQNGEWSIVTPSCQAIACEDPGYPDHGFQIGGVFRFPNTVRFECFPGYKLQGLEEIQCQENAEWNGETPECIPCPINTYWEDRTTGSLCIACPENSHTTIEGSNSRHQCLCNDGYSGPPGGPCITIECPLQNVPINGVRLTCELNVGDVCTFQCNPGYFPSAGTSTLTCLQNGAWSGQPLTCTACPENTYNENDSVSNANVCLPCGEHLTTEGRIGQNKAGCVCETGWDGPAGGPCSDLDECSVYEETEGESLCSDVCVNLPGTFQCECSIPGYEVDPNDPFNCFANDQCRNLTSDDAPLNGALVCKWFTGRNSIFCSAKCNDGYEFLSQANNYDTCGPDTDYNWSFELSNVDPSGEARITDCTEQFFPGFQLQAEVDYLPTICQELTEEQKTEVKEQFISVLVEDGLCAVTPIGRCAIENVEIICGHRQKRDATGNAVDCPECVAFKFAITAVDLQSIDNPEEDCDQLICPALRIPPSICRRYCVSAYGRYVKAVIRLAQLKLITMDLTRARFTAFNELFVPENILVNGASGMCSQPGHVFHPDSRDSGSCVPCKEGTFLNDEGVCENCPPGSHQLLVAQGFCSPCPLGSYSEEGWAYCFICEDGWFGINCQSRCSCVNGTCDRQTGECKCHSGWEGTSCTVDIDRCANVMCPLGQTCLDKHPPEDGFECF